MSIAHMVHQSNIREGMTDAACRRAGQSPSRGESAGNMRLASGHREEARDVDIILCGRADEGVIQSRQVACYTSPLEAKRGAPMNQPAATPQMERGLHFPLACLGPQVQYGAKAGIPLES
jgi:hypothetical protein